MNITVSDNFLSELVKLIEWYEGIVENEFGVGKGMTERIESGEMSDVYYEAVRLLNDHKN